jgi:hypothetical protein
VLVVLGAVAMMGCAAQVFAGRPEFGNFSDAGAVAMGLEKYTGRLPAVLFALVLIDACIIDASAASLSTAYAVGDVLSLKHSLHRKPNQAKGFYGVYCGLTLMADAPIRCCLLGNGPGGTTTEASRNPRRFPVREANLRPQAWSKSGAHEHAAASHQRQANIAHDRPDGRAAARGRAWCVQAPLASALRHRP